MSKTREILRRLERLTLNENGNLLASHPEASSLWPRFTKVVNAISRSLREQPPPQGINRQFNTFNWSGVDEGIHDHNGIISGQTNGIELNIKLKGTTIDDQQQYVIGSDERWRLVHTRERYIDIVGKFVSADGKKGAIEMQYKVQILGSSINEQWQYKAFWLQARNGFLQLEQVVGPNGVTFDAGKLEPDKKDVTIPGTHITVARLVS